MSEELAIVSSTPEGLRIPSATSFSLSGGTTFDTWWEYRHELSALEKARKEIEIAVPLRTMDWLFWGENTFGEDASQATAFVQDVLGWSPKTYTDYRRVWERYAPERRHDYLGISMYQAVMSIEESTADELLGLASRLGWTRVELRRAANQFLPDKATRIAAVTRADIERAARNVLHGLVPAPPKDGGEPHYKTTDIESVVELSTLLDYGIIELVIEGQVEITDEVL